MKLMKKQWTMYSCAHTEFDKQLKHVVSQYPIVAIALGDTKLSQ